MNRHAINWKKKEIYDKTVPGKIAEHLAKVKQGRMIYKQST